MIRKMASAAQAAVNPDKITAIGMKTVFQACLSRIGIVMIAPSAIKKPKPLQAG